MKKYNSELGRALNSEEIEADSKAREQEDAPKDPSRRKLIKDAAVAAGAVGAGLYAAGKMSGDEAQGQGIFNEIGDVLRRKKELEAREQRDSDAVFLRRVEVLARSVDQDFNDIEQNFDSVIRKHERKFRENNSTKLTNNDIAIFGEGLVSLNENFENLIRLTGKTGPAANQGKLPADNTEKIGVWAGVVFRGLGIGGQGSMDARGDKENSARWARSGASDVGVRVLERGKSTISQLQRRINDNDIFDHDPQSKETIEKVLKVLIAMRRIASGYLSNELGNTNPTLEQPSKDDNSQRKNKSIDDLKKLDSLNF